MPTPSPNAYYRSRSVALLLTVATSACAPNKPDTSRRSVPLIESHYRNILERGLDSYGPRKTPLWLASIDIHKGGQFEPAPENSRRTYRTIHAPRGSTLYWDQPLAAFAVWLSGHTGETGPGEAAKAYVREMFSCCIDEHTGMLEWGNHLYYDVFEDRAANIYEPYHEIRPMTPAWGLLWQVDARAAERALRAAVEGHVRDWETGLFNRHARTGADRSQVESGDPMPFLAAGASLVESLAWLSAREVDDAAVLQQKALAIARYSFDNRDPGTGLVPTQPFVQRWDSKVATTETGLWAAALLRSWRLTGVEEFRQMAREALLAYLETGWDGEAERYYGMLQLTDGAPRAERTTEWQPGLHSDVWEPLFPSHDYPMAFAEACLTLWEIERDERFALCARRWIEQIRAQMPPRYPRDSITDSELQRGAFAESYGRAIHFLVRAADVLDEPAAKGLAREIADDAVAELWVEEAGMFRTHPGEDRTDAVDGLGYLFAALIYLETGEEPDLGGMAF